MRRFVLILALVALAIGSTGCFCYDCCDYLHPRPCPNVPSCDCPPCGERLDYSEHGLYP